MNSPCIKYVLLSLVFLYSTTVAYAQTTASEWYAKGLEAEDTRLKVKFYNKAIELNPNDAYAYNNRGIAKGKLGDYRGAIDDFNQAIKVDPDNDKAFYNKGIAYEKLGDCGEAIDHYEQALKLNPAHRRAQAKLRELRGDCKKEKPQVWAVAAGVGQYKYSSLLTNLWSPVSSAYEFRLYMEKQGLVAGDIPILVNNKAKKEAILSEMRSVLCGPKVQANDLVIFYFSGHGMAIGDGFGICPFEYYDNQQLISDQEILQVMARSKAKHKVCIIESCKTNSEFMGTSLDPAVLNQFNAQREAVGEGVVFITSSKVGMPSWELPDKGGIFSYYFLRAIQGKADEEGVMADSDSDGLLTAKELFDFVQRNVKELMDQEPQINSEGYRDIPLFLLNK